MKYLKYSIYLVSTFAGLVTPAFAEIGSELEDFFNTNIEPQMQLCSACHIPNGLADIEGGDGFLLYSDRTHYQSFFDAWTLLGEGVHNNPLLVMNSDPTLNHTGFQNWPTTSAIYENVARLLTCWDTPDLCSITPPPHSADLAISMAGNDGENNDGVIRYTITVTNSGPGTADSLEIGHHLPVLVTLSEVTPSSIAFTSDDDEVTFYLDALPKGSSQTIGVAVNTDTTNNTKMIFTSTVSAITEDTNPENNTSTEYFGGGIVNTEADLSISMTGHNGKNEDGVINYTITVRNAGPDTADSLVISHKLPARVELSTVKPSTVEYTSDGDLIIFNLDSLDKGTSQSINITVKTATDNKDKMNFTASVIAETQDPNLANNSSEEKFGGSINWLIIALLGLIYVERALTRVKATSYRAHGL